MSAGPSGKRKNQEVAVAMSYEQRRTILCEQNLHMQLYCNRICTQMEGTAPLFGNKHCRKLHTLLVRLDAQVWLQTNCSTFVSSFFMFFSLSQPPPYTDICTLAFYFSSCFTAAHPVEVFVLLGLHRLLLITYCFALCMQLKLSFWVEIII